QAEADATAQAEAAQAEADATAQAEAAQTEADAAAQAEAAQAEADATAQAEAAQAEAEAAAEAEATQAEADATAQAEAAQAEADATAQAEAEAKAAEAAQVEAEAAVNEAEASAQKDAEIIAAQEEAQNLAAVTAATEAATEAATAEAEAAAAADTTTEVVVEGEARSSDQEFTTQATNRADTTTEARAADRDRGLSALEKGGLLALGALAVGAIMSNGQRVAATSGDRVIVEDDSGRFQVLKDDDAVLRQPGSTVQTRRFDDGSTTSTVTREDGSRVVTIRDASGRVLRRSVFDLDGRESLLIDDIRRVEPVNVSTLPPVQPRRAEIGGRTDRDALRAALRAAEARDLGRTFSLRQVRDIVEVRELAAEIGLEDVTFRTGSAAIQPSEAEQLREIGLLMRELIRENPREVFLVEGYTDAVGNAAFNLLLSDRRAESVALALSEYFGVPPENMVVQGYGERFLKIPTLEAERLNRRVSVRRITNLIAQR
ncbi:MAG: OmpA family protein, partial [Rhodobacterales bacterium]